GLPDLAKAASAQALDELVTRDGLDVRLGLDGHQRGPRTSVPTKIIVEAVTAPTSSLFRARNTTSNASQRHGRTGALASHGRETRVAGGATSKSNGETTVWPIA